MIENMEGDLFLLFNLAFDGLDKQDLARATKEADLEDIKPYIPERGDEPSQVALINTRNKLYPKALLIRKVVDGKAVVFAFWKRGSVCEGMAVSLDGASPLNEFIWIQDAATGKFKASLRPRVDANQKKERQAMMTRAAVSTVVVDSLNRAEYRSQFGGDILQKLKQERGKLMESMKKRGLIPKTAQDPMNAALGIPAVGMGSAPPGYTHSATGQAGKVGQPPAPAPAAKAPTLLGIGRDGKISFTAPSTHEEFVAVQGGDGGISAATHKVSGESASEKLMRELQREAQLADKEDGRK
jgi:hypothetical protein